MAERHIGYEIELLGFPDIPIDHAAGDLSRAFGIPVDKATRLIEKSPVRVAKGIQRPQAERYVKALLSIGADVRVQGSGRERIYLATAGTLQEVTWTGPQQAISERAAKTRQAKPDPSTKPKAPAPAKPPRPPRVKPASLGPAEGQVVCPKCGLEQPRSDTCARCGIVYEKFIRRQSGEFQAIDSASGHSADHDTTGSGSFGSVPSSISTDSIAVATPRDDPFIAAPEEDDNLFRRGRQIVELGRMLRPEDAFASSGFTPGVTEAAFRTKDSGPKPQVAAMALRRPTGRAAEMVRGSSDVGFWNKIGEAFVFSVKGQSYQWLSLMAALGAMTWVILHFASMTPVFYITIIGWFVSYIFFAAFLATQWRFFANAFIAATTDRGEEQPPLTELGEFRSQFVLPGEILSLGAAILWSPIIYTIVRAIDTNIPPSPTRIALFALIPLLYWPMGMAFVTASGRLTEVFIVTGIVRGMAIGGIEYVFVAIMGVVAFFGTMYLIGAAGEAAVYHWMLLYVALGYISGVQGYLLGKLLRRRPKMVEGVEVEEVDDLD